MSEKASDILIRSLSPTGWASVASKQDIDRLEHATHLELRAAMSDLRTEMHIELAGLRTEMNDRVTEVRAEMNAGFTALRKELHEQTNRIFLGLMAMNTLMMSVAVAAFKFL